MILSHEYVLYTYIQETYIETIQFDELELMLFKKKLIHHGLMSNTCSTFTIHDSDLNLFAKKIK
jgi:hypothetical protein